MPHRSLQLLLLRFANERWLSRECLLKMSQKLGNVGPIPHAAPVSEVRVVNPPFHSHMLPRSYQHFPAWYHIDHRRLLWIRLGRPYFDRKAVGRAAKVNRECSGNTEQQCRTAILVGVDLCSRAQRWKGGERVRGIGVYSLRVLVFLRMCERMSS